MAVFDTLEWLTSMISNGPPAMKKSATLHASGRCTEGADAKEKSERGVVRGDSTGVRVRRGHDSGGGPEVRRASPDGPGGDRSRDASGESAGAAAPAAV